jgi:hypothetical protein
MKNSLIEQVELKNAFGSQILDVEGNNGVEMGSGHHSDVGSSLPTEDGIGFGFQEF